MKTIAIAGLVGLFAAGGCNLLDSATGNVTDQFTGTVHFQIFTDYQDQQDRFQEQGSLTLALLNGTVTGSGEYYYSVTEPCVGLCSNEGQCASGEGCPPLASQSVHSQTGVDISGGSISISVATGEYLLAAGRPRIPILWKMVECCTPPTSGNYADAGDGALNAIESELQMGATLPRTLAGSKTFFAPQIHGMATVDWNLTRKETNKLIIDEPAGYAMWLPQGGKDEMTPGNAIPIHARLVAIKDGGPPDEPASDFTFELVGPVSTNPGVALNFPIAGATTPDLQFDAKSNPNLTLTNLGLTADTMMGTQVTDVTALVSSYDYGAYGSVRVTATMQSDGRKIVGYVNDDPSRAELLLPKRTNGSHVGDAYKARVADLSDDDDSDATPAGDGTKGDGLSFYEEYRGIIENGIYVPLDPKTKDLFVYVDDSNNDTADVNLGIAAFTAGTKLDVHYQLLATEFPDSRIINANNAEHHLIDQHGVRLSEDPSSSDGEAVGSGPGPPRTCTVAKLPPLNMASGAARGQTEHQLFAAHELGHCVGIKHHGDGDLGYVSWSETLDGGGNVTGYMEQRLNTDNNPPTPSGSAYSFVLDSPPDPPFWPIPELYVSTPNCEHSGWRGCFMRYDNNNAYIPPPNAFSTHRVFLPTANQETAGLGLCDATNGHMTDPIHGTPTRGDCQGQIHVNDAQ